MREAIRAMAIGMSVLFASPIHAEVLDSGPAGFTLENVEIVPVDPDRAWRSLVDDIGRWWPSDHTWWGDATRLSLTPRAGGCFCEIDGPRHAEHMRVVFVDPGRLLRLTGGLGPLQGMGLHGVLEWRLSPEADGGTRIAMFYRAGGYSPDDLAAFAAVVDRVQGGQLGALAEHLRRSVAPE